jgi:D-alanyl-D-alanine carboxypeptidase
MRQIKHVSRASKSAVLAIATVFTMVTLTSPASASHASLQAGMNNIVSGGYPAAWAKDTRDGAAAAGFANTATGQLATANMKMRAGSVTKTFVATVALQLVDENKLNLNDTVEQWLPGLLPYGSSVTIQQLLQHTSGIPDYLESGSSPLYTEFIRKSIPANPEYDPTFKDKTWTPQQLIARVSSEPRIVLPANAASYSNTNYIIAGLIIEKATGKNLRAELRQRIFEPLGLTKTSFPLTNTSIAGVYAHGYSYNVDPLTGLPVKGATYEFTNYNPSLVWAAGAVVSTPKDVNTFLTALLSGQLLSSGLLDQMKQGVPFINPANGLSSGLGLWVWNLADFGGCNKTIYGHEGEIPGYNTWAFATGDGSRSLTVANNLLLPDYETQFYPYMITTYISLWCAD